MCHSADNSLEANLAAQGNMLRNGIAAPKDMPNLAYDAENAERWYQQLAAQLGLTPEKFREKTGYRLNDSPDPLQIH